jgi:octanoyl-[GcvH]:protein N-octanoyltransferase
MTQRLVLTSFPDDGYLDTAVSAALLRQVARGDVDSTIRLHRTGPILAFGRLDKLRPGYRNAVDIAREHGYEPVERLAGGRAAVFHEGTISFSRAIRESSNAGAYSGTRERFAEMAGQVAEALATLGVDARVGEVSGEYCPGEFSVNARGESKLAGIGQRVIVGGAHVGGVIVVRGAGRIREVLEPIYEALELDWQPDTTGSVALETSNDDETMGAKEPDPLIEETITAIRQTLSKTLDLEQTDLAPSTLKLAADLRRDHVPS